MRETNKRITRRRVLYGSGALALAGLAGCSSNSDTGSEPSTTQPSQSDETTTQSTTAAPSYEGVLGQTGSGMIHIPYDVAATDWLSDRTDGRMSGSVKYIQSGQLQMQTVVSGDVDVYSGPMSLPLTAAQAGNDLKIVAPKTLGTDYVLAVKEGLSFSDFENSDHSFGISSPGASSQVQPLAVFNKEGVDTSAVNWLKIGGSGDRTKAIAAGRVDGTAIHLDQFKRIQDRGVEALAYVKDYFPNFVQQLLAVRGEFIENEETSAWLQEFLNLQVEASKRAANDVDWLFENTQKFQAETLDKEQFKEVWELNNEIDAWPYREEQFNEEGLRDWLPQLDQVGIIDLDQIDFDAILETEFYSQACANLDS